MEPNNEDDLTPVYVRWIDHSSFEKSMWRDLDDVANLPLIEIETLGWILKETDKILIIVPHISEVGNGTGEMCISKSCIIERKELTI